MGNSRPGEPVPAGARRRALRIGAPIAVLAVVAAGTAQAAEAATGAAAAHTPTAVGSVAAAPAGATAAAAPSDSTEATVSVLLAPRNGAALQQYASAVSDPSSPLYKQYLSSQQVSSAFAPSGATVQTVEAALRKAGLTPGTVGGDNLDIQVTASLGQLKSAFGIGFAGYKLGGRTAYGATTAPKFDGTVAPLIQGVLGLDDFAQYQSDDTSVRKPAQLHSTTASTSSRAKQATSNAAPLQMCSVFSSALQGKGLVDGTSYYSPSSLDSVYGLTSQLSAGNIGAGQTVAVVEFEGVSQDAITDYEQCFGSQAPVTYTPVDGGSTVQPTDNNGVGIEAALDIETFAALAPGASIIDYEGPDASSGSFSDADWLDTMMAPVTANKAKVISMSWSAGCEALADSDKTLTSGENTVFQLAAAQGQTFVNSSGDQGSTECSTWTTANTTVSPSDPANNPYVTGVGGTSDQGISSVSTTTWNDSKAKAGASGGGVSAYVAMPSATNYQSGFTGAGYTNACKAASGTTCRQEPDVSALADPNTGFPIIYYGPDTDIDDSYYTVEGGTSWAAPIVGAIAALTDNTPACQSNGSLGLLNPALYALAKSSTNYAADFTDVTTGSNAYTPDSASNKLYAAGKGYDLATGLGVLKPGAWTALCARPSATSTVYALGPGNASVLEWTGSATGWMTIGGSAGTLIAGSAGLFATTPNGSEILKYDGVPGQWTQVGGSAAQFVVSGGTLYALAANRSYIAKWNGSGTSWTVVGGSAQQMVPAATGVFATSTGNASIYKYNSSTNTWAYVGGAGSQFASSGNNLFGLGPSGSYVAEWTGTGSSWTIVGGSAGTLYGGGLGLFATNKANTALEQFDNTPDSWTGVGGGGKSFAVSQTNLYGQNNSGLIFGYTGTPNDWTELSGVTPASIVAG